MRSGGALPRLIAAQLLGLKEALGSAQPGAAEK